MQKVRESDRTKRTKSSLVNCSVDCIRVNLLREYESRRSISLRPVLTATIACSSISSERRRRRHHKGGTALRLATVSASTTRRRINQTQRVRCVLFAYQVPPGAEPPRANLLPISAPARLPAAATGNVRG